MSITPQARTPVKSASGGTTAPVRHRLLVCRNGADTTHTPCAERAGAAQPLETSTAAASRVSGVRRHTDTEKDFCRRDTAAVAAAETAPAMAQLDVTVSPPDAPVQRSPRGSPRSVAGADPPVDAPGDVAGAPVDWSPAPVAKRAPSLSSSSLVFSQPLRDDDSGNEAAHAVAVTHHNTEAAAPAESLSPAANVADADALQLCTPLPVTPQRSAQVRFVRVAAPLRQGEHEVGAAEAAAVVEEMAEQDPRAPPVVHEGADGSAPPPRTPPLDGMHTSLHNADSNGDGEGRATVSALLQDSQTVRSPTVAAPREPRRRIAFFALEEEASTGAATVSDEDSRGCLTLTPTSPCLASGASCVMGTASPPPEAEAARCAALSMEDGCGSGVTARPPDAAAYVEPQQPQQQQQQQPRSASPLSPTCRPQSRTCVSLSTGRGPSGSSGGCSDSGNTPESHPTRRSTPCGAADRDDDGEDGPRDGSPTVETAAAPTTAPATPAEGSPPSISATRAPIVAALCPAYTRGEDPRWASVLPCGDALLAEHQSSVLTTFMAACGAAWLPPTTLSGLVHVNAAAYVPPSAAEQAETRGAADSELRVLFRMYRTSPSEAAAAQLCATYFAVQLSRYDNWARHLAFELLYVHTVAVRVMRMLELHERRLTCMRRDLGVRDAIELFVLLAPRPRAPTASAGRGVLSAFRMALHALGGRDSVGTNEAVTRGSGSCSTRAPPLSAVTALSATTCQPTQEEERRQHCPPRVEPLFASEQCGTGRPTPAAVGDAELDARVTHGGPVEEPLAAREVIGAMPPRESLERQRGTPRPLNKTYADYYRLVAEKSSGGASGSSGSWLPRLTRTASRSTAAPAKSAAPVQGSAAPSPVSSRPDGSDAASLSNVAGGARRGTDTVLSGGRLRAKERVPMKKRRRTPPPPPTESDFINLHDAEALERYIK
ncbi:hypothetical protein NESM_000333200 [Novymonas esmeraldas]|uniref:Uncharacterized protein n=1 Tax=Novymonas esmeraldas TaxID=1808958 RepID=A0AAW0EMT0_9TRYP